jgi:hypothetical protein
MNQVQSTSSVYKPLALASKPTPLLPRALAKPATAPQPVSVKSVVAKPLSPVTPSPSIFLSSTDFLSQRPTETTFASEVASSSISFVKAYNQGYEMAADTGFRAIDGQSANQINATVALKKGVTYSLNTSFGLSNSKGNVILSVQDANGLTLKSQAGAIGKTSIKSTFTPTADGVYTLTLKGQPIPGKPTAPTTNLYQSYQIQVGQPLSKLPSTSGNANVDALVLGGVGGVNSTNAWHHALGSVASVSTNVIDGALKSLNNVVGNNNTISYAFMDNAFFKNLTGKDNAAPSVMDNKTKAAVTTAFDYLSSLINVKFTQASSISEATIVFGENSQKKDGSAGYANPPNQSGLHQQYLFLANDADTNDSTKNNGFATGTYGWQTLIHEVAHTMGLKHPFNGNAGGGGTPPPYLPTPTNNHRYSIMSYTSAADSKALATQVTTTAKGTSAVVNPTQINPATFMTYDIAALQYLYGANTSVSSADAKLSSIQKLDFTDAYQGMETLWTPNGGVLNASQTSHQNIIDLRGGAYSSINYLGTGAAQVSKALTAGGITKSQDQNFYLNNFKSITNAAYTGNNNVALAYGSKITEAQGGSADDSFYVGNYSSKLVGGAGKDWVFLTGTANDWVASNNAKLEATGGQLNSDITLTNKTTKAAITVSGIERYAFYSAGSFLTKNLS